MSINFLKVIIRFVKPPEKLVRFMVVRVEYDRSNRVCIRRTGNRPSYAVAQGGQFFYRGAGPLCPPPLAPGLAVCM